MGKFLNIYIMLIPLIAAVITAFFTMKGALLFYGMYSLGMYVHISVTTLSNMMSGNTVDKEADLFWKTTSLIIGTLCIAIGVIL